MAKKRINFNEYTVSDMFDHIRLVESNEFKPEEGLVRLHGSTDKRSTTRQLYENKKLDEAGLFGKKEPKATVDLEKNEQPDTSKVQPDKLSQGDDAAIKKIGSNILAAIKNGKLEEEMIRLRLNVAQVYNKFLSKGDKAGAQNFMQAFNGPTIALKAMKIIGVDNNTLGVCCYPGEYFSGEQTFVYGLNYGLVFGEDSNEEQPFVAVSIFETPHDSKTGNTEEELKKPLNVTEACYQLSDVLDGSSFSLDEKNELVRKLSMVDTKTYIKLADDMVASIYDYMSQFVAKLGYSLQDNKGPIAQLKGYVRRLTNGKPNTYIKPSQIDASWLEAFKKEEPNEETNESLQEGKKKVCPKCGKDPCVCESKVDEACGENKKKVNIGEKKRSMADGPLPINEEEEITETQGEPQNKANLKLKNIYLKLLQAQGNERSVYDKITKRRKLRKVGSTGRDYEEVLVHHLDDTKGDNGLKTSDLNKVVFITPKDGYTVKQIHDYITLEKTDNEALNNVTVDYIQNNEVKQTTVADVIAKSKGRGVLYEATNESLDEAVKTFVDDEVLNKIRKYAMDSLSDAYDYVYVDSARRIDSVGTASGDEPHDIIKAELTYITNDREEEYVTKTYKVYDNGEVKEVSNESLNEDVNQRPIVSDELWNDYLDTWRREFNLSEAEIDRDIKPRYPWFFLYKSGRNARENFIPIEKGHAKVFSRDEIKKYFKGMDITPYIKYDYPIRGKSFRGDEVEKYYDADDEFLIAGYRTLDDDYWTEYYITDSGYITANVKSVDPEKWDRLLKEYGLTESLEDTSIDETFNPNAYNYFIDNVKGGVDFDALSDEEFDELENEYETWYDNRPSLYEFIANILGDDFVEEPEVMEYYKRRYEEIYGK